LTLPYKVLGLCALTMWGVYFLNLMLFNSINQLGIRPREGLGLIGIVTSPFLHGSFYHLLGNTLPFVVMSALIATFYERDFLNILIGITFATGLCTWLFGAINSLHIGASGVVFGLTGFTITAGFLTKQFIPMSIAIIVIAYYGMTLLFGLIPSRKGVSYLGHWMGLFSGMGIAYLYNITP